MSKATVEHDFFGINERTAGRLRPGGQRNSIQGIRSAIDPQLLRSVIASAPAPPAAAAAASRAFLSRPPSPLLFLSPTSRAVNGCPPGTAPLTIFFNGTVNVFHVRHDEAEAIIKLAEEGSAAAVNDRAELNGDLPMARRKSLQLFLEKRKERLTASAPYGSQESVVGSVKRREVGTTMASHF